MKSIFSDPFAPVEIHPITVAGEPVPTRVAVRVKGDDGAFHVQGILGRDYQLLPNRKVRDIAEDIMSRTPSQYGGFDNLKTLWDGKHYVDYFASSNAIAEISNGWDLRLKLGLMAWNSYDGTRKVGFEIFALNPYCTNQYHSRNRFGFFAWRHDPDEAGRIDADEALDGIAIGARNVIAIAPRIHELCKQPLSTRLLLDAKKHLALPQTKWGDVLDQLGHEEENAFGLFQALTSVATHRLAGLSSIALGTAITEHFLVPPAPPAVNHTTAEAVLASKA
jgi:hypothetical protein